MQDLTLLQILFPVAFLSQVGLVSAYLPVRLLARVRFILKAYPPSDYPKLYPVPNERVEAALRRYLLMNMIPLLIGLSLLTAWFTGSGREALQDQSHVVLMLFFLLQIAPLAFLTRTAGFVYFNPTRNLQVSSTRRADLNRRRPLDLVPLRLLVATTAVYVGFATVAIYMTVVGDPRFNGPTNLASVTLVNAVLAGLILRSIYGRRQDPYEASEDWTGRTIGAIRFALWTSIVLTLFVTLAVALRAFELSEFEPASMSVYFQLVALLVFSRFRIESVDFEVYGRDPIAPCLAPVDKRPSR